MPRGLLPHVPAPSYHMPARRAVTFFRGSLPRDNASACYITPRCAVTCPRGLLLRVLTASCHMSPAACCHMLATSCQTSAWSPVTCFCVFYHIDPHGPVTKPHGVMSHELAASNHLAPQRAAACPPDVLSWPRGVLFHVHTQPSVKWPRVSLFLSHESPFMYPFSMLLLDPRLFHVRCSFDCL